MMKKLQRKQAEKLKEEQIHEEKVKEYWSIGAKDETKKIQKEQKMQEMIRKREIRKKLYEEDYGVQ